MPAKKIRKLTFTDSSRPNLQSIYISMKSYQVHYLEIHMEESDSQNELLLEGYKKLFDELLDAYNLSRMEIFEKLDLVSSTMSSKPSLTEPLLRTTRLPYLEFLICNN